MESAPGAELKNEAASYEAPRLEMHGSVAEVTKASIIGIVVDKPGLPAGASIFGNTSL